jgi:SAM-dependent MidA family methyltransferase
MIARAGLVRFDEFMGEALYGAEGFYTSGGGRAGRRGDFLTSPEVGPLFGAMVAAFLDAEWERTGRPDPFVVVDAGAGPGTLARAVLSAGAACAAAMHFVAVELSAEQRAMHPVGVESRASMPDGPFDGVVIANELLDNLPFRLAVYDGGWRESHVEVRNDGTLVEVLASPLIPVPAMLPERASLGARAPLQDDAHRWVDDALGRVRSGCVVAIDYFVATTGELAGRPWREWLRTYRRHGRGNHYLVDPGEQDITAEVAIDQLPPPTTAHTQAEWLRRLGIDELVDAGRRYWEQHADRPDLDAIRMRSRTREAEALLDPAGLGAFTVCEWRVTPDGCHTA